MKRDIGSLGFILVLGALLITSVGIGGYYYGVFRHTCYMNLHPKPAIILEVKVPVDRVKYVDKIVKIYIPYKEPTKSVKIIQTSKMLGTFEVLPISKVDLVDFEIVSGAIGINSTSNTALSAILNNLREAHKDKVLLMISTSGGAVQDAMAMYDTVKFFQRQGMTIYTFGNGYCHSAGITLLQAGQKRFISQHATMILHNPYIEDDGTKKYVGVNGKPYITDEELLQDLMKENARHWALFKETTHNNKELLKLWQTPKDHELTPRDALRLGLIDGVL